jgi:hypothetical protein
MDPAREIMSVEVPGGPLAVELTGSPADAVLAAARS